MSATPYEFGAVPAPASKTISDAEVEELLDIETEIEIVVVDNNKARAGGCFFPYINITWFVYDLFKHGIQTKQTVNKQTSINITVYT